MQRYASISRVDRAVHVLQPPPGRSASFRAAFTKGRGQLASDLAIYWGDTFRRLGTPVGDAVCVARLWAFLVEVAEAHHRDALLAMSDDWRDAAAARAFLFDRTALIVRDAIAEAEATGFQPAG